jgi:PAS domain S-box-containing protein
LLEDNSRDAELIQELLEADNFVCEVTRVQTHAEFVAGLENAGIDLILADYKLPSFDGLSALKLALDSRADLPFIFVSWSLGEEVAIEAVKIGATDYVVKSRLSRLVPSVQRALREARECAERKKAEEAFRRSEMYLAEAQRLSHTGSFGWNISSGEIFWSEESFRIFGYDSNVKPSIELVVQRVHPDDLALVQRVIDRAANDQQDFDFEHRLLMPDGSVKHLHVVAHAVRDDPGRLQFMGALMDITARKKAEEELRDSEQRYQHVRAEFARAARISMLGELAASIAHEINQPLAAVTMSGEAALIWLDRSDPNLGEARELMQCIIDDAGRAADIIARIRSMAVGRAPQQTTLSLHDVIEESMIFLRHELQSKDVAVSLDLAPAFPGVMGDRIQLQQVVVNLAINAVQAMAQSGTARRALLIQTKLSDVKTLCCTFEDSGPGIDPGQLDHLFDSLFTTKNSGMGVGLSISRSIIELHGGQIRADNKSALGGARFSFELPTNDDAFG